MRRLIINADDFGLTNGINRAVLELNQRGVLTSTTLIAVADYTKDAAAFSLSQRNLGVGCHVVLVDGRPILSPSQLPTLVNQGTGRFRASLGGFVRDLVLGRIRESEVQAEAEAQIAHLQSLGLQLTHLDTHKHTHMFPGTLRPILRAAKSLRISSIRNPFEPKWSIDATADSPLLRRLQVRFLRGQEARFLRTVNSAGLKTTDGALGVLATGTLDTATITSLLRAMPEGTWELVTHPGHDDAQLRQAGTRLTASRQVELDVLQSLALDSSIQLIHFGGLEAAMKYMGN